MSTKYKTVSEDEKEVEAPLEITIANTKPPKAVWDKAHKMFTIDDSRTVYTYGTTIHNPGNTPVDEFLKKHEAVHVLQQKAIGGPATWWDKYFSDPKFRQEQELQAYRAQYRAVCAHTKDRNARAKYLWEIATHFSSKMYSAGISFSEALKAIRS